MHRLPAAAALGLTVAALLATPAARAGTPAAAPTVAPAGPAAPAPLALSTAGQLAGDAEAFAVRVEYDIPLPASTGSVPHVVGTVGRSNGGGSAHGIAAAPSRLDAVVGGQFVDPNGANNGKPMNRLPQSECYAPGPDQDHVFRFPTDTQNGTSSLPATSFSAAQCSIAPQLNLHAYDAGIGVPATPTASFAPVLTSGPATAEGTSGPVEGKLISDASATAHGVDILGGVIRIGALTVHGRSAASGAPGGATTAGDVRFADMTVAGTPVALANDVITVAGQSAPVDSTVGRSLVDQLNAGLAPSKCRLAVLSQPGVYPQGFILSRPAPKVGVRADGTEAASMFAGMQVLCDVPQSVSSQAGGFSPERVQIVLGFAFTSAKVAGDPGGFGLSDLGGSALVPIDRTARTDAAPPAASGLPPQSSENVAAAPLPSAPLPPVRSIAPAAAPRAVPIVSRLFDPTLAPATRAALLFGCLLGWLGLTVVALRRLRGVTAG